MQNNYLQLFVLHLAVKKALLLQLIQEKQPIACPGFMQPTAQKLGRRLNCIGTFDVLVKRIFLLGCMDNRTLLYLIFMPQGTGRAKSILHARHTIYAYS